MSHSSSDSVSYQTITQPTSEAGPDSRLATLIGASAVLLWGSLALLTSLTGGRIPPFQMMSVSFGIAFVLMAIRWWLRGESGLAYARQPREAWLLGRSSHRPHRYTEDIGRQSQRKRHTRPKERARAHVKGATNRAGREAK